jgi:hypothetical protein
LAVTFAFLCGTEDALATTVTVVVAVELVVDDEPVVAVPVASGGVAVVAVPVVEPDVAVLIVFGAPCARTGGVEPLLELPVLAVPVPPALLVAPSLPPLAVPVPLPLPPVEELEPLPPFDPPPPPAVTLRLPPPGPLAGAASGGLSLVEGAPGAREPGPEAGDPTGG